MNPIPEKYRPSKPLALVLFYTVGLIVLWNVLDLGQYILSFQNMSLPNYYAYLFVLAYIIRGFFYFPSLYFIIIASIVFPFPVSVLAYYGGVFGSAILSYTIGRLIRSRDMFPRLRSFVERDDIRARIDRDGTKGLFFFHVTGISLDIPNYLSGYLYMPFRKFIIVVAAANFITGAAYFTLYYYGLIDVIAWLA